jgi:hypothetical protein
VDPSQSPHDVIFSAPRPTPHPFTPLTLAATTSPHPFTPPHAPYPTPRHVFTHRSPDLMDWYTYWADRLKPEYELREVAALGLLTAY